MYLLHLLILFALMYGVLTPTPLNSKGGNRYYVLFVEDYTRYTWLYFMHNRSDFFHIYQMFTAMVCTQFSATIKIFRFDSGGEYLSRRFRDFLVAQGTIPRLSCPRV